MTLSHLGSTPYLTLNYPELGTGPIPAEPYRSPAYFQREKDLIFRKVWLNLARAEELPENGDYVVRDIPTLNISVLLVRGADGRIRAFHNMCSHRGNRVVLEPSGNAASFNCIFHAWTYNTQGDLIAMPDEEMFFGLDKAQCGLTPIACDQWAGWVCVNLDPKPARGLREWLGPLGERIESYPFHEYTAYAEWKAEVGCNWKLGMDAFQEAYHVAGTHGGSLGRLFLSRSNPFGHIPAAELHGPHRMLTVVTGGQEYRLSPAASLAARFGGRRMAVRTLQNALVPTGCNPKGAPDWAFDIFVFFPNILIDLTGDGFFTHQFWPVAHDRCLYTSRRYYRPASNAGEKWAQELSKCMFRDVLVEDCTTIELTQQGLASGAKDLLYFSDQELLCRHQHYVVEQFLKGEQP